MNTPFTFHLIPFKHLFEHALVCRMRLSNHTLRHCLFNMGKKRSNESLEIRKYILARCNLGVSRDIISEEVTHLFGESAVSKKTVYRWVSRFNHGRQSISDDKHSGRPTYAVTNSNISKIRELLKIDGTLTVREIANTIGISTGSVFTILKSKLNFKKICARWIPHILTKEQKNERLQKCQKLLKMYNKMGHIQLSELVTGDETWVHFFQPERKIKNQVWIGENMRRPTIARRALTTKKVLYAIFFNANGIVTQYPVPRGRSITANLYTSTILPKLHKYYKKDAQRLDSKV